MTARDHVEAAAGAVFIFSMLYLVMSL